MKKILLIITIISLTQLFMSCENWFDVNPKSQVKNSVLFENENGFKTALFGIYTTMATGSLYGQDLTMSFMDALGQYYTIGSSSHNYYRASIYDYESSTVKYWSDAVWEDMYKIIMNCNNLLENMEGKESLFSHQNYDLIRGEAFGIRAYLHFDLLRMFAPSFAVGINQSAIPYVDKVQRSPFSQLTNEEVVKRILEDCKIALKALEVSDPFGPAGDKVNRDDTFLEKRKERMNYYAVKALMARVYLWAGNVAEAKSTSEELIANRELGIIGTLFELYSDKLVTYSDKYFTVNSESSDQLSMSQNQRKEFYETDRYQSFDNRLLWLVLNPKTIISDDKSNTGRYFVNKYTKEGGMYEDMPLIRMSEMYYINAECQISEKEALEQLNTVRRAYGIPEALDLKEGEKVFADELFKEYRKTFLAEGQLFYFMKRKDFQKIPGVVEIEQPRTVFCLPIPEGEKEFGVLIN